jgi:hypothetical protein
MEREEITRVCVSGCPNISHASMDDPGGRGSSRGEFGGICIVRPVVTLGLSISKRRFRYLKYISRTTRGFREPFDGHP